MMTEKERQAEMEQGRLKVLKAMKEHENRMKEDPEYRQKCEKLRKGMKEYLYFDGQPKNTD